MKRKHFSKKLTLGKVTVNTLDQHAQERVKAGGYPTYNMPTCYGEGCGTVAQTTYCLSEVWWNC